jgi:hypothetical protein
MRSGPPSTLLLVLALAVVFGAAVPAAGAPAGAPDSLDVRAQTDDLTREGTTIELQVLSDGDARWTLSLRYELDDADETEAFDRLAVEFETGEAGVAYFETMRRASVAAADHTGREMALEEVNRTSEVRTDPETNTTTGVLRLSFVWTNFARIENGSVWVDDAFYTGANETWFSGLTTDQTFVVRPPPGYGVDTAPTGSRDGVLRWEGPEAFEPGYLEIRYQQLADGTTDGGPGTEGPNPPGGDDRSLLLVVGGLIGLGVVAVGVLVFSRRGTTDGGAGTETEAGAGSGAGAVDANGGTDGGTPGAATDTGGATGDDGTGDDVDLELLSDEERVEYLLERNGGRMKQANIVKETGWSNAKVSQLLSGMDEAGQVEKLRIGRENLISLPGEDVGEFEE